jgi:hypothetical protein
MRRIAERFPGPRGPKGEHGEQGAQGAQGKTGEALSPALRRALCWLFAALFALVVLCFAAVYLQQRSSDAALLRLQRANEQQWCGSISQIVHIPVPVPTADNPSRVTWARYEQITRHRGMELGCRMPPPRYAQSKPGG